MGSLVAAVASYLEAQRHSGDWLVRIEDIDPPREVPGAGDQILRALDIHGFQYASPVLQHTRLDAYKSTIETLIAAGQAYQCSCTRQVIEATARRGRIGLVYPGTCRDGIADPDKGDYALRLRTSTQQLSFNDQLQGMQSCRLEPEVGDFVIRRRDGLIAYQLAVVVDDAWQGITDVVRGIDLLDATFMQIYLQKLLGYAEPRYHHIPIIIDTNGEKLSKQTGAPALNLRNPVRNIFQALVLLKQSPDKNLSKAKLDDVWAWAIQHWNPAALAGQQQIPSDESMIVSVNRTLEQ